MKKFFKHPWIIIVTILVVTGFFTIQLPKLKINNEVKIFLPKNHKSRIANDKMEEVYGSSEVMAVALHVKSGNIFKLKVIKTIKNLENKIEKLDNVKKVDGLTSTDYIDGSADGMKVGPIVKELPKTQEDLNNIKGKLLDWKLYRGNLYSKDLKSTQILVKLKKGIKIEEQEKIYFEIKDILKEYSSNNIEYFVAGTPVITVLMGKYMKSDMRHLIPFVLIIVLLSLYLSFKNVGGVVLPSLTVLVSTVWTLGLMAMLNVNLTLVSTVIPVLLIAVGSAYGIHIISHYYDEIKTIDKCGITEEEHRKLIFETLHKVGKPVLLAGLTTIAGFGSLATSSIIPIKNFGIFTAIGVTAALIVALTLIPALLLLRHKSMKCEGEDEEEGLISRVLIGFYHYFGKKAIRILTLATIIVIISIVGMSKVIIDSPLIDMFKNTTEIKIANKFDNNNFNGTTVLNVLIDGPKNKKGEYEKGSMVNPEILKSMDNLKIYLKDNYKDVGEVTSFADFIKRMNKVMNYPQDNIVDNTPTQDSGNIDNSSSFGDNSFGDAGDNSSFGDNSFSTEATKSAIVTKTAKTTKDIVKKKVDKKDIITLMNNAILSANKVDLTAEELIKIIDKELNYKGEAYNEIPYDISKYPATKRSELKNLISQYLLLYSGNLNDFIDDQLEPSRSRMMIQIKTGSNIVTEKIEKAVYKYAKEYFPKGYTVSVAGSADMGLAVNKLIISSQIMSIISSLIIVFIIVALSYKSFVAGIYGTIPLGLALLINFGLMGFMGIKLDIGTAMVASIAIGIGVDYTIHFLSTYNYERKRSDDLEEVTKKTLLTSGKAIIFNAVSVALGFAVLLFSNFMPLVNLGLLISVTMVTSSLASMTVLPALLNIFKPKFISK